jgi:hypothetical protein
MDPQGTTGAAALSHQARHTIRFGVITASTLFLLLSADRLNAQNDPIERTFAEARAEVEKAVATAKAASSGKLPALEGFVGQTLQPVERYERAYYQCLFQVIPSLTGETSVRVTAKITAWYDDPDKLHSGYQILSSNGRLENDALDRVQEILEGSAAKPTASAPAKINLALGPVIPRGAPPYRASSAESPANTRPPAGSPTSSAVTESEIEELRKKRALAEKRVQQLNIALQNLQQLSDGQTTPTNLAAIKKTGTPVLPRPDDGGKPLFAATEKDQFEIVEMRGDWVHVQISGESRGWIRKSQLEFPDNASGAAVAAATDGVNSSKFFHVTREETGAFPGNWAALRDQTVKLYSVQPVESANAKTTPREKRAFLLELFLRAAKERTATGSTAGVVVVFDSADGGLAATTFATLDDWQNGKLSEAEFWQGCSLDPQETFSVNRSKP